MPGRTSCGYMRIAMFYDSSLQDTPVYLSVFTQKNSSQLCCTWCEMLPVVNFHV
ncbi:MAG: hypothetical protein ABIT08_06260 [Bacteroidia bacterium]